MRRARFTDSGEVLDESTFATENGHLETQVPLPMGCGERPLETLPLFATLEEDAFYAGRPEYFQEVK